MNIIRENDGSRVEAVFSSRQIAKLVTMADNRYICDMVQDYIDLVAISKEEDDAVIRSVAAIGSVISDIVSVLKPEYKDEVKARLKSDLSEEAKMIKENFWCFHLPSGEVTVGRIEQIIKQGISRGFKPDLIIIDYFECLET